MNDTVERDAVADRFYWHHYRKPLSSAAIDQLVIADMADHIVRLERILLAVRAAIAAAEREVDA